MSESQRGGPKKMGEEELQQFLATPRWASLCIRDSGDGLRVLPVWVQEASPTSMQLVSPRPLTSSGPAGAPACLVADHFESYVGIRGAIVRGAATVSMADGASGTSHLSLRLRTAHGFSFENTTLSL